MARPESERIPELDGLRAIAILGVLLWHCVAIPLGPEHGIVKALLSVGRSGVDLFFVLSGFLIGSILLKSRGADNFFTAFYARRALRILPPYYATLLVWLAAKHGSLPETMSPIATWQYAAFVQNFGMTAHATYGSSWMGGTWSLAIEEQFYLVCPLLVAILPSRALPWVLATIVGLAPAIRATRHWFGANDWFAYVALPARADALAM